VSKVDINEFGVKNTFDQRTFESDEQVNKYLDELNISIDSNFDYIIVNIPEEVLKDQDLSFISCVDFLDMIGIPEPDEKLNEISSQKNLCIITHEGLDAAFILKSLGSDRGKIYPKDLIELGKSNIFKRNLHPNEEKNLPPKLVSIWAFNIKNENYDYSETNDYYENNRQNYKRYLEATLASISKKVMSQESKEKLRALNIETDENYRKYRNNHEIYFYFKNAEYEEMKKRIDSLLIFPPNNGLRKDTVKSLINIINEIKQFKNEKLFRNILIKLSQFNTNLIGSFFSIMSKDENGKMFQFLNNKVNTRI